MRARGHIQLMLTAGRKWLRKIYFEKIVAKTAFGKGNVIFPMPFEKSMSETSVACTIKVLRL